MADDERICRMRQEERGDLALNDQCRAFSDAFMNLDPGHSRQLG